MPATCDQPSRFSVSALVPWRVMLSPTQRMRKAAGHPSSRSEPRCVELGLVILAILSAQQRGRDEGHDNEAGTKE